jgi:diguanylate cyclase (GGDEF)-like protein
MISTSRYRNMAIPHPIGNLRPLPARDDGNAVPSGSTEFGVTGQVYWRRMIGSIAVSWGIDALLLGAFAATHTIAVGIAVAYAATGFCWYAFSHRVISRLSPQQLKDAPLVLALAVSATAVQLVFIALAPQISFYFMLVLFIVFGYGAMGLSVRQGVTAWALVITSVALELRASRATSWLPQTTLAEHWLVLLCYTTVLGRCMLLGIYKQSLRLRAQRKRQQLSESVETRDKSLGLISAELQHQATHDALTGLPNRAAFGERLAEAIILGRPFAVAILDLDRFKVINDSLGHGAGDALLRLVAQRLLLSVRSQDMVARAGGDEFLLLIRDVEERQEIEVLASRWIDVVAQPYRLHSTDLHVSPSIGIARFPDDAADAQKLLARADEAMYHAKQNGRNAFHFFDCEVATFSRERLVLEAELRHAIAESELFLEYQPRVTLLSGGVQSVEALLRWQHPTRGRLMPVDFIAIAEDSGLILQIGAWVIEEACRQARAWQLQGLPFARIAVNVSPGQFRQADFVDHVYEALESNGLDARYLEIELTEATLMTNAAKSVAMLERLSDLGVMLAIDDFGTGYSSMSYLQRFPIDMLKIDRSFIRDLHSNPNDVTIVRAIVSLAHGLGLTVVAEGVELVDQLAVLERLGCDEYQGFLCSAAVAAAEAGCFLGPGDPGPDTLASTGRQRLLSRSA